jgi:hypothetical protein
METQSQWHKGKRTSAGALKNGQLHAELKSERERNCVYVMDVN